MFGFELALIIMLVVLIPFGLIITPMDPSNMAGIAPVVLAGFFIAASLNLTGLLLSAPRLRRLPRSVWNGWTFVHEERTPSVPDISQPWFGVVYAPLFNPNEIRAGRMIIRGLDTTAALASCISLLLCVGALLASGITRESNSGVFAVSILLALSLLVLSATTGFVVYGIGRSALKGKRQSEKSKPGEVNTMARGITLSWLLQLPYLVCLYGLTASIMPLLSLHLDKNPVSGMTAIIYLIIRACLLTFILMLLLHAPRKLLMLSSGKPHLASWLIYSVSFAAFFIWLLLDWLFHIP